jgi:hypothetical protein
VTDVDWRERGDCLPLMSGDPETWDPVFYGETTAERAPAKEVCKACPVREECLSDALERSEIWGVWGGCDEVDLRRALWLDTNGSERTRRRYPRCPSCRARTENLFVRSECSVEDGSVSRSVECGACDFSWAAPTSVAAIEQFWDDRDASEVVVPIRRPARVAVPRGRIPFGRPARAGRPNLSRSPERTQDRAVRALVASSGPRTP